MIILDVEQVVATDTNRIGINITATAVDSIAEDFRAIAKLNYRGGGRIRFVKAKANTTPRGVGGGIRHRFATKVFGHSHSQLRIFAGVNCRNVGLFCFATSRCCPVYLLIGYYRRKS